MKHPLHVRIDRRERATILAALRFHQDENLRSGPAPADAFIAGLASDGGAGAPLTAAEIDTLCRRLHRAGGRKQPAARKGGPD
jgi:hypothetical protein